MSHIESAFRELTSATGARQNWCFLLEPNESKMCLNPQIIHNIRKLHVVQAEEGTFGFVGFVRQQTVAFLKCVVLAVQEKKHEAAKIISAFPCPDVFSFTLITKFYNHCTPIIQMDLEETRNQYPNHLKALLIMEIDFMINKVTNPTFCPNLSDYLIVIKNGVTNVVAYELRERKTVNTHKRKTRELPSEKIFEEVQREMAMLKAEREAENVRARIQSTLALNSVRFHESVPATQQRIIDNMKLRLESHVIRAVSDCMTIVLMDHFTYPCLREVFFDELDTHHDFPIIDFVTFPLAHVDLITRLIVGQNSIGKVCRREAIGLGIDLCNISGFTPSDRWLSEVFAYAHMCLNGQIKCGWKDSLDPFNKEYIYRPSFNVVFFAMYDTLPYLFQHGKFNMVSFKKRESFI